MKLNRKVVLFVLLMILPLNIVSVFVTANAMYTTIEQTAMTDRQVAQTCVNNLSGKMSTVVSTLYYFATEDADCIQMMRQQDEEAYTSAKLKFFVSLKHMTRMIDGADGYFYFMEKRNDWLFDNTGENAKRLSREALSELLPENQNRGWRIYDIDGISYLVLIQGSNSIQYGAWIDLDRIRDGIVESMGYDTTQLIFSQNELATPDGDMVGAVAFARGIYVSVAQDRAEVLQNISPTAVIVFAAALIYLVAIPVLCGFINHYLLKPLQTVTEANQEIQKGNLDYRIREQGKSPEYDEVFQSFNTMAEDLKTTKIDYYETEAEKQKVELRNLQLQIRPHFLLNTFNLIYTLSLRKENDQIGETILYLSDYFRFVARSSNDLEEFQKELELIQGYLKVANLRYRDMIEATMDIRPEVQRVGVPPLLIHNFVENTVKHGVHQGQILHITLRGWCQEHMAVFQIEDDGNGMDPAILEKNRRIFIGELNLDNKNEHIGLYNSFRRLRLLFGDAASIEVESQMNQGTCFTIRFPCKMEKENEITDCQ